jgi:hypothetical protein
MSVPSGDQDRAVERLRAAGGEDPLALSDADANDFSWCVHDDALAAAPSEAPPARLGTYRLGRCLGRGAGGAVYLARCTSLDRNVALKVLHAADPEDVARFLGEARAVARLRHTNIVAVHEVGCDLGRWFIAFELVRGETLARRIEAAGRLEPREAARVALRLARALHYAHGRGLLHRDVKPANVVMAPGGEPLLTDFGLVKDIRAKDAGLTLQGDVLGTPSYMAPEQARAEALDPRCDVYSLGATLHEMLAGAPPFSGQAMQVLAAVLSEAPAPLPPLAPGDAPLAAIVARCLEKDRARRYDGAGDLARDLERFLAGDALLAGGAGASSRLRAIGQRPEVRRAVAAGACAVALAVLLFALVTSPREDDGAGAASVGSAGAATDAVRVSLEPAAARAARERGAGGGAGPQGEADAHDDARRPRAPRVAIAPPTATDRVPPGEGPQAPGGRRRGDRFSRLPGAPAPVGLGEGEDDPLVGGGDALTGGAAGPRDRLAREARARARGVEEAEGVASVETDTPGVAPEVVAAEEPRAPATTPATTPATETSGHDDEEEDHHDDDDDDDDDDELEDDDYRQVLQPAFDPDGYTWDSYYQANTSPQGYVSTLQPLATGDLLVAAVPARIDGIPPDDGAARVEASLPSPVSTTASVGGVTFAATADPSTPGAGDVYARATSGTWTLAFDGPRREARVVSLGPTLYAVSGDAQDGALVHARDAIDGGWRQAADLGRCVPGAAVAYRGEVWIGARGPDGDPARVFRGAGGTWAAVREPFDGREPSSGERQEVTALLAVDRFLFAAVATFDPGGAPAHGQVMALGKERFKRVADLTLDAPLALAYVDETLYVGTRRGRLLVLDRAGSTLELRLVAELPTNSGVFALAPRDARTLLVGVQGPYGAEVLRRVAR